MYTWQIAGWFRSKCQCCNLVLEKKLFQEGFLYLGRVQMVNALAPLLPGDALPALPDRVHVAVVHTLAQQVLLKLEAACAGGRVPGPGVGGPGTKPVILRPCVQWVGWPAWPRRVMVTSIAAAAPSTPPLSDTSELVTSLWFLKWKTL